MAKLMATTFDIQAGLDQFEAEPDRDLLDFIIVIDENLVVVEELYLDRIFWTLFALPEGRRIPLAERYESQNGVNDKYSLGEGFIASILIQVDKKTGFETVKETVIDESSQHEVYTSTRPRYAKSTSENLAQRFHYFLANEQKKQQAYEIQLNDFSNADATTKVIILQKLFRQQWRINSEQGLSSPEWFLSSTQFDAYDQDPGFRVALTAAVHAEARLLGLDADALLNSIFHHYTATSSSG